MNEQTVLHQKLCWRSAWCARNPVDIRQYTPMYTTFKFINLTFKALHIGHPPHMYLANLLQYHKPARFTSSSASHLLTLPQHNLSSGSRVFHIAAPKLWNSLPSNILECQTVASFRCHLKTHYFQSAYPAALVHIQSIMRPNSLLRCWRFINHLFTYLLT